MVITITIKFVNEVQPTDSHYMQFFNIVLRSAMEKLQLEEIRRNYYDPKVRYILSIQLFIHRSGFMSYVWHAGCCKAYCSQA